MQTLDVANFIEYEIDQYDSEGWYSVKVYLTVEDNKTQIVLTDQQIKQLQLMPIIEKEVEKIQKRRIS